MNLSPEIILTKDGSHTLKSPIYSAGYHSVHGAIQESKYVFIEAGLASWLKKHQEKEIQIFEMGLGTGLNAFLTLLEAEKRNIKVDYTAIEAHPIDLETALRLNYLEQLEAINKQSEFEKIHTGGFDISNCITDNFSLTKFKENLLKFELPAQYNLIYYDAFAPNDQPELWTADVFKKLFRNSKTNGMLLTYCAKGDVKRALQAAGWTVEKIPGPPGKREMIRAIKP